MPAKKELLKKIISYVSPITIEQATSDFNPELDVIMTNGRYQLISSNAIYSYEDKYDNFKKSFKIIDWNRFNPKKVLVLGLGLGSVIQLLEENFDQSASYTAVEIDESVIYLAEKYILKELNSPIEVICTDALNFVQIDTATYDLILMDVFKDDKIPREFKNIGFLNLLQDALAPAGIIMYNCLASTQKDRNQSTEFYKSTFQKVFKNSHLADVHENYILFHDSQFLKI